GPAAALDRPPGRPPAPPGRPPPRIAPARVPRGRGPPQVPWRPVRYSCPGGDRPLAVFHRGSTMPFFRTLRAPFGRRLAAVAALALLGLPLPTRSVADPDDGAPVQLTVKRRKILVPPPNGMVSV